jgi:hypothetical protein
MIHSCPMPFFFGELSGSLWQSRFIAAEYSIYLNQSSERYIIQDRELRVSPSDSRIKKYKDEISAYFKDQKQLRRKSPWNILLDLRRIKDSLFSEEELIRNDRSDSSRRKGQGFAGGVKWEEIAYANLRYSGAWGRIWIDRGLEPRIQKANKLLLISDSKQTWSHDVYTWLYPWRETKELFCAVFNNRLYRGVDYNFALKTVQSDFNGALYIHLLDFLKLPFDGQNLQFLEEFRCRGGLIIAKGLWPYLAMYKSIPGFIFALANNEWLSMPLFQAPLPAGSDREHDSQMAVSPHTPIQGIAAYQRETFPNVCITGISYNPLSLIDFLKHKPAQTFQRRHEARRKYVESMVERFHFRAIIGAYRITTGRIEQTEVGVPESHLVSGLLVEEQKVKLVPLLLGSKKNPFELPLDGIGFLTSFNYYCTPNLVSLYNEQVSEKEKIPDSNLLIDSIGIFKDDAFFESIPLYFKAFLGYTKDGFLFAGYYGIKRITLSTREAVVLFTEDRINPKKESERPELFTPSYEKISVGRDKYCLAIIQDHLIYNGRGPCRIPPVGVVVTFPEPISMETAPLKWSIEYAGLPCRKESLEWIFGGFTLLVHRGRNLYRTEEEGLSTLASEGWHLEQSMMTQETQLVPSQRQPRALIGKTTMGRLMLLIISGRTNLSVGVGFPEAINLASHFLDREEAFDFVLNLDGGASASLIAFEQDEKMLLSHPAPSPDNPAGVARPLPSFLCLKLRS